MYLNLRSGSITGTVLAASSPVFMPDGFGYLDNGVTNCLFIPPVPVIPGTTYYFDVNVLSGDEWDVDDYHYHYTNGTEFLMGQPYGLDLWFREGIIVPLVSNPVRNENGSVTIRGSMLPSTTNVTQVATNLIQLTSWQNLATNIADTNGTWQVTDSAATNQPVRFYRAVTL